MKTFFKIFIIFFIIISFYIFRDNIILWVGNVYSYFNNIDKISSLKLKEEIKLPNKVDIPGALRVVDNALNINSDITLSKDNVIILTNKARKENGNLTQLVENDKLDLSAEKKLEDMFAKQYFEHVSPSGVSIADLGNQTGYEYILIGENLAMGNFKDDQALIDAWMASPGHRANILNKNYTEIGVAVGKGKFEGKNVWMAVQHFGTPRSVCPSIDQVLFGVIGINQSKIQQMENDLVAEKDKIDSGTLLEGSTYLEEVNSYNKLINIYNNLLEDTKQKINNYNSQINALNYCILGNQ